MVWVDVEWSLLRSPAELLHEIILVDDASSGPEHGHLGARLEQYVSTQLPATPVTILRAPARVGLIRARLLGAAEATGSVLTFLDSHVEVKYFLLVTQIFFLSPGDPRVAGASAGGGGQGPEDGGLPHHRRHLGRDIRVRVGLGPHLGRLQLEAELPVVHR